MKQVGFCILSILLFSACDLITEPSSKKADIIIINESIDTSTTSYNKPVIFGTLKNIGDATAYNCIVQAIAYKNNIVIDFATDFIESGIEIPPRHYKAFIIIFSDLHSHFEYDRYELKTTFLSK